MAVAIGPVAQHVEVVDDFLAATQRFAIGQAKRGARRKNQDAAVIVTQAQFVGTAQHAVATDAEDRLRFDYAAIGHTGAGGGQRDDVARLHVEGAAPDMALDAVACVDKHTMHLRRVGVRLGAQYLRGDDAGD